ncbi:MAG TPA: hypothetical protein VHF88_09600 [Thermoleophilaceae bacterium]|nr:hypothetical protein [Thermoleophilaceae bacterium]
MRSAMRIGVFAGGLAVVFGAAFLAGGVFDPDVEDGEPTAHRAAAATHEGDASAPARVLLASSRFERGAGQTLAFRVVDREGRNVEDFDVEHGRRMHLIAVRHDLTGYRHLHPRPTGDGGWTVDVDFMAAGPHRVYADFVTRGKPYTLSADVDVAGRYAAQTLPAPATSSDAGDGYEVEVARHGGERRFTVSRDGEPVDDIEPYLGARGHLVAIAEGDLAFEHVHPKDGATEGREIRFDVAFGGPGRYRLFLQFKHDGKVRTAAFTERVGGGEPAHGDDGHGY